MPIVVECAECGGKFRAKDSLKDQEVPCPKCEKTLVVTGPRVPEYDVFLSHSSSDVVAANAICHALEEKRIRCWIAPRDIPPGKKWASAIVDGLAESRVLVLLLTDEAVLSPQVMNEIQQAVQQNLIIFPIRLKDVQLTTELSYFISRSHWLDAFPPPLDEYLNGIVKSVRALLVDDPNSDSKVDFPQTRQTITSAPEKKSRRRFPVFPMLLLAGILGACFISWKLFGEPSVSEMLAYFTSSERAINYDVFISHASADHESAIAICNDFEASDLKCWMAPRDLSPGNDLITASKDALKKSRTLVLLLSKQSTLSLQVLAEIRMAEKLKIGIIPIQIEENIELSEEIAKVLYSTHVRNLPNQFNGYASSDLNGVQVLRSSDINATTPIVNIPHLPSPVGPIIATTFDPLVAVKPGPEMAYVAPPVPWPDLVSTPGKIDFSQTIAGRLPQGWSGSNFVGVDLGDGAPAIKLSPQQSKGNETIFLDEIRLGGDFFIELQALSANAQKFALKLDSTTDDQSLEIQLEKTRNDGWVMTYEGVPYYKLEETQRPFVASWIRIEHTSDGLFVLADADSSRQKKLGDPKQAQFDRLSITFPPGSNEREIQNLRWGPLVDEPIPATVKFDPPNQRGPNGLPQGWIRLAGQDGSVRQRIAARNLVIGEQFAIDLEVQSNSGCEFTLNLIGAGDGPTLPISFYLHRGTITVRALNGSYPLEYGNDPVRIRIERDQENFTVRSSADTNIVSFRSDAFEGFDQIEFDLTNSAQGTFKLIQPPSVRLP